VKKHISLFKPHGEEAA